MIECSYSFETVMYTTSGKTSGEFTNQSFCNWLAGFKGVWEFTSKGGCFTTPPPPLDEGLKLYQVFTPSADLSTLIIVRLTCVRSEIWYPGSKICK